MKSNKAVVSWLIALAAVGAIVFVGYRTVAVEAVYPFERMHRVLWRGLADRLCGMYDGATAAAENRELKRRLDGLLLLREDYDKSLAENDRLRRALSYMTAHRQEWLSAGVLSRGGGAAAVHQTLRVSQGSLAGVRVGAVVVVPEGIVGRVTAVTPHTAEVTLITDPSVKIACEIEGEANSMVRGIICGGSEELLQLKYTTGGERRIPVRSRVFSSGVGGVFPRGLNIGFWIGDGEVLPVVEFSALQDVFIRREKQ